MATFDERLKDIKVDELVIFPDRTVQVNGYDLEGRHVWILLNFLNPPTVKFFEG